MCRTARSSIPLENTGQTRVVRRARWAGGRQAASLRFRVDPMRQLVTTKVQYHLYVEVALYARPIPAAETPVRSMLVL